MADKLHLGSEVRELKIGQSFTNSKAGAFHTIRYDFKPASVDINKIATVDVGGSNQVTVTVPHLDGAGVPQTVFKGSHRPFQKECVLIIDRATGEITLEKLSSNIQVKKTRSESAKPQLPLASAAAAAAAVAARSSTPPICQRQSNKTRVSTGSRRPERPITHLVPKHSPLQASPSPSYPSPGRHKSPKRDREPQAPPPSHNGESHSQSTLASLPLIGVDDFAEPAAQPPAPPALPPPATAFAPSDHESGVDEMSDSSSSSSSSDSDSDGPSAARNRSNGHHGGDSLPSLRAGGAPGNKMSMPTQLLNEDLRLSESGSDSD